MTVEWREQALSELCSFLNRGSAPSYVQSGGVLVLNQKCVRDQIVSLDEARRTDPTVKPITAERFVQPFDILVNSTGFGTLGRVGQILEVAEPTTVDSHITIVRADPGRVHPRYLGFAVRNQQKEIELLAEGSTGQTELGRGRLADLRIAVPPSREQSAVVEILGALDDKIHLNRRMSATLEAASHEVFTSWFVHFDPVRAKSERRESGLPKPIAELFPTSLVDSDIGKIPEGWRVGPVSAIADVVYGAPFDSAQFNAEGRGLPLIRIRDLVHETPSISTLETHPKGYKVQPGDIVVGMDGEFRAYLWSGDEAWLNQRVCVFVPKADYSAAFVRNSIIEPLRQVESTETATTVIHLGKNDIDRFSIVIPSANVIRAFNELCQPWYDRVVAARREARNLTELRDLLLPKLVTGELQVNDIEKFVGRAV
jgi:type I restriction enzyme S subunit